jgi:hypothetical protein
MIIWRGWSKDLFANIRTAVGGDVMCTAIAIPHSKRLGSLQLRVSHGTLGFWSSCEGLLNAKVKSGDQEDSVQVRVLDSTFKFMEKVHVSDCRGFFHR